MQSLGSNLSSDPRSYATSFESSSSGVRVNAQEPNFALNDIFSKSYAQPAPPLVIDESSSTNTPPPNPNTSSTNTNANTNANSQTGSQNPAQTYSGASSSHQPYTSGLVSLSSSYSSYSSSSTGPPKQGSNPAGEDGVGVHEDQNAGEGEGEGAGASDLATKAPKPVISYQKLKPSSKKKLPSFRHFTRKGVEYILRTPLRRGMPKPNVERREVKRWKSGAMWAEDVVAFLQGKAGEETNDLVVSHSSVVTKKILRELRDKLMIDEEGVIRTKRAFHYNARVTGSVLLWPEEVKVVMKHKFMEFGSLDDIEGFFEQFWSWYQPKYATEELEFRRNLTEHVYEFDEISRLENEEEVLAERLHAVRKSKLAKLGQIQQALKASPLGGELKSLSDMRHEAEKHLHQNPKT